MQIQFTIEQVQQLLTALGEVPTKYGINLVTFVKSIAEPQIAEQQQQQPEVPTSAE